MINKDSFRFLLSGGRKKQILELYDLVRPLTYEHIKKIRIGNKDADGGYVMVDDFNGITGSLSLGIGFDISWDISMTKIGIPIYQYDHTVNAPAEVAENPLLHFHKCGIASVTDAELHMKSISDILSDEMAAHSGDLILKMDIDGYEWDVLDKMPHDVLMRFRQICMEIHNPIARPGQASRRNRNLRVLRKLFTSFAPVHLHANNASPTRVILGLEIPKLLEITYIRRDGQKFSVSNEEFPGEFDTPNIPSRPEIPIGNIIQAKP